MTRVASELLVGLAEDEAAEIVALGSPARLAPGDLVFELGDAAESLYLLEAGRVALSLPMQVRGTAQDILIEERTPGQAFGWSALVPPHRFTLKASTSMESQVLALPRAALVEHFARRPEVGYVVSRNVSAIVGQRLQVLQAMWLREMQRVVELSSV